MSLTPRLLLVDDSRVARLTLKHLITVSGIEASISEAANADEALALFEAGERFDKALIDYNMPGRDGIELAAEIRKFQPELTMVLVTANIQDAIRTKAAELDLAFLGKPVDEQQLAQFLNS